MKQFEMYEICEEMRFRLGPFVLLLFRLAGLCPQAMWIKSLIHNDASSSMSALVPQQDCP
jgi:hypothetical protein